MKRRVRIFAVAATLAALGALVIAPPAHAVETQAVLGPIVVSSFDDGNHGWLKLVLEKDLSNSQIRAKFTVWCEPDTIVGGSKVTCGAVSVSALTGSFPIEAQGVPCGNYFDNGTGKWEEFNSSGCVVATGTDSSPPLAGYTDNTGWGCSNGGFDDYRATVSEFRIQSPAGQWGGWKERVTPTDHSLSVCHT